MDHDEYFDHDKDPEMNQESHHESVDILDKLKKVTEGPEDDYLGNLPGEEGFGPGGPDAEMGNPEMGSEDDEEKLPIELELKTDELKSSGYEL